MLERFAVDVKSPKRLSSSVVSERATGADVLHRYGERNHLSCTRHDRRAGALDDFDCPLLQNDLWIELHGHIVRSRHRIVAAIYTASRDRVYMRLCLRARHSCLERATVIERPH